MEFVTDILRENLSNNSNHNLYDIVVITGPEIYIGTKCGKKMNHIYSKRTKLSRKHNEGGQSPQRFGRKRV